MKDERYKQIMSELGMPNSRSLLSALQQVANEAGQECAAAEREVCAKLVEEMGEAPEDFDYPGVFYALQDAAKLIRGRNK